MAEDDDTTNNEVFEELRRRIRRSYTERRSDTDRREDSDRQVLGRRTGSDRRTTERRKNTCITCGSYFAVERQGENVCPNCKRKALAPPPPSGPRRG